MNIAPVICNISRLNLSNKSAYSKTFFNSNGYDSVSFTCNKKHDRKETLSLISASSMKDYSKEILSTLDRKADELIKLSNTAIENAEEIRNIVLNLYNSNVSNMPDTEKTFQNGDPIVGGKEAARVYAAKDGKIIIGRLKGGIVTRTYVASRNEISEYFYKENGELEKYKNKQGNENMFMRFAPSKIEYKKQTGAGEQSDSIKEHSLIRMNENGKIRYAGFINTSGTNKTILQKKKTEGGFIVSKTENGVKTEELVKSND